jgi:hypothetical protein
MKILLYKLSPIGLCSKLQRSERRGVEGITRKVWGRRRSELGSQRGLLLYPQERGGGMVGSGKLGQQSSNKKPESVCEKGGNGWINTDLDISSG